MAHSKQKKSGSDGKHRKETKEERRVRLERQTQARDVSSFIQSLFRRDIYESFLTFASIFDLRYVFMTANSSPRPFFTLFNSL